MHSFNCQYDEIQILSPKEGLVAVDKLLQEMDVYMTKITVQKAPKDFIDTMTYLKAHFTPILEEKRKEFELAVS